MEDIYELRYEVRKLDDYLFLAGNGLYQIDDHIASLNSLVVDYKQNRDKANKNRKIVDQLYKEVSERILDNEANIDFDLQKETDSLNALIEKIRKILYEQRILWVSVKKELSEKAREYNIDYGDDYNPEMAIHVIIDYNSGVEFRFRCPLTEQEVMASFDERTLKSFTVVQRSGDSMKITEANRMDK